MNTQTNTLFHGDCLSILPTLASQSVDFILTDPPYLVNYQSRDGRTVPNDGNDAWLEPAFAEMYRVLKSDSFAISFYGWPSADKLLYAYRAAGFRVVGHLMFPKRYASSTAYMKCQHEGAHLIAKGTPWQVAEPIGDVIAWDYTGNILHPTQKPVKPLQKLIETFCPEGGLVLDPFAGSGSTLAAAQLAGRKWLGVELDSGYYEIAHNRLRGMAHGLPLTCEARASAKPVREPAAA